ncbi:MAG: ROK family glucokinase [Arcanobacterium sp.]|nr:ROK family glucokinase [Arcanobacterium sp.]
MTLTIGVDVGGTKIAAGVVNKNGKILKKVRKDTPHQDGDGAVQVIIELINELQAEYKVSGVGIGTAGFVDGSRTSVIFAPNMHWRNLSLAVIVSAQVDLPVVVENDANAAAWGEFKFGAAKGKRSAIAVTVGTGIGGGIIYDGRLLRGSYGFGAEIGHMNLVPDGNLCGCGQRGCWEAHASGNALVRYARQHAANNPQRCAGLLELANGVAEEITGLQITEAATNGCQGALDCFDEISRWIGQGMANLAAIFDPEIFVLGGGVSDAGDLLLEPTQKYFHEFLTAREYRPVPNVVLASMGNQAGITGAASLALTN